MIRLCPVHGEVPQGERCACDEEPSQLERVSLIAARLANEEQRRLNARHIRKAAAFLKERS